MVDESKPNQEVEERMNQIQEIFKKMGLDTNEKRNSFLQFDYEKKTEDVLKYLKVTTVTHLVK